jgi:hypothetical protein
VSIVRTFVKEFLETDRLLARCTRTGEACKPVYSLAKSLKAPFGELVSPNSTYITSFMGQERGLRKQLLLKATRRSYLWKEYNRAGWSFPFPVGGACPANAKAAGAKLPNSTRPSVYNFGPMNEFSGN